MSVLFCVLCVVWFLYVFGVFDFVWMCVCVCGLRVLCLGGCARCCRRMFCVSVCLCLVCDV